MVGVLEIQLWGVILRTVLYFSVACFKTGELFSHNELFFPNSVSRVASLNAAFYDTLYCVDNSIRESTEAIIINSPKI